jgi:hypothetical protein
VVEELAPRPIGAEPDTADVSKWSSRGSSPRPPGCKSKTRRRPGSASCGTSSRLARRLRVFRAAEPRPADPKPYQEPYHARRLRPANRDRCAEALDVAAVSPLAAGAYLGRGQPDEHPSGRLSSFPSIEGASECRSLVGSRATACWVLRTAGKRQCSQVGRVLARFSDEPGPGVSGSGGSSRPTAAIVEELGDEENVTELAAALPCAWLARLESNQGSLALDNRLFLDTPRLGGEKPLRKDSPQCASSRPTPCALRAAR